MMVKKVRVRLLALRNESLYPSLSNCCLRVARIRRPLLMNAVIQQTIKTKRTIRLRSKKEEKRGDGGCSFALRVQSEVSAQRTANMHCQNTAVV
jgi:hypothetical protein